MKRSTVGRRSWRVLPASSCGLPCSRLAASNDLHNELSPAHSLAFRELAPTPDPFLPPPYSHPCQIALMRSILSYSVISIVAWYTSPAFAQGPQRVYLVEIFTDSGNPVSTAAAGALGVSTTTYELDAIDQLEAELSEGLSSEPETAREQAARRIQAMGPEAMKRRGRAGAEALEKAYRYGLTRFPAIVVNGGAGVIYGITDLRSAVDIAAARLGS